MLAQAAASAAGVCLLPPNQHATATGRAHSHSLATHSGRPALLASADPHRARLLRRRPAPASAPPTTAAASSSNDGPGRLRLRLPWQRPPPAPRRRRVLPQPVLPVEKPGTLKARPQRPSLPAPQEQRQQPLRSRAWRVLFCLHPPPTTHHRTPPG